MLASLVGETTVDAFWSAPAWASAKRVVCTYVICVIVSGVLDVKVIGELHGGFQQRVSSALGCLDSRQPTPIVTVAPGARVSSQRGGAPTPRRGDG
eukprot:scaffold32923_cov75-Phaeocystis_antarctica.AAC.1